MELNKIYPGDCIEVLKTLPDASVNCCVTSPPYYGLRDYGHADQIGLEETPEIYVSKLVEVFREVKRVLKTDGTLWLNLGDSYSSHKDCKSIGQTLAIGTNREHAHEMELGKSRVRDSKMLKSQGYKNKDLIGIPWLVAFALRADGWYLRQDIIWHKPNPMPESVTDRCTKSHEYIFLMSKSQKYYFDYEAIQEEATGYDGRNDTVMKGSEKYADGEYLQMGNANSLSTKGRERWKFKSKPVFGNRDGELNGLHSGNEWSPKFKNLQDKGQPTHSFHESRAEGIPDELSPIRNKRDVWKVATKPYREAHFATYPEELIVDCIKAGCPEKLFTCNCCGHDVYLQSKTNGYDTENENMSELPEGISGSGLQKQREDILFKELQFNVDSQTQENNERLDDKQQGVQNDSNAHTSNVNQIRICDGTQTGDGKLSGKVSNKGRNSTSFEQYQNGQQDRKSAIINKIFSRQTTQTSEETDLLSSLWEENKSIGTCPKCGKGGMIARKGVVLDCFMGAGTTGLVARKLNRNYVGIELNEQYIKIAEKRIINQIGLFI